LCGPCSWLWLSLYFLEGEKGASVSQRIEHLSKAEEAKAKLQQGPRLQQVV